MLPVAKSSFMTRRISKEDAIIQFLRPQQANKISQTLDVFERMVVEAETLTTLGVKLQPGVNNGENFFVTPEDLKTNLDEFPELVKFATEGRAFLNSMGYVTQRRSSPLTGEGSSPVGKSVEIQPFQVALPGSEPLAGVTISPKNEA